MTDQCSSCIHQEVCRYQKDVANVKSCIDQTFVSDQDNSFQIVRESSLVSYEMSCRLYQSKPYPVKQLEAWEIKQAIANIVKASPDPDEICLGNLALAYLEMYYGPVRVWEEEKERQKKDES